MRDQSQVGRNKSSQFRQVSDVTPLPERREALVRPTGITAIVACLALLLISLVPTQVRSQDDATYAVGVSKADITPDYPIRLNGFGGRREESAGVSQQIYARSIAISQADETPLVLIAIDSLGIRINMVDELARRLNERFNIPRENVVITFTHSHCTPKVNGASDNIFSQPIPPAHQEHIDRYTLELTNKIEQAAVAAIDSREPAKLSWGVGNVGFAMNRRTPGGPVDHDLPMLIVRDVQDDRIRAVYVSYACHCVTLSFNQISGDWAGHAAEMIERTTPGAMAFVSIGCGSDSNPSSGVTGDKVEIAESQGVEIATEVARLLKTGLKPVTGSPHATLNRISLPLNDPPSKEQLQTLVEKGGPAGYNASTQLAKLERGETLLTAIDYPIQTFSFGDNLSMVFLAGEVCADYSLRLKSELDRERLWLNAYSNDFCSYIPSERLVVEGGYGGGSETPYFALPSTLKPGLEQLIIDEVKRQVPGSLHLGTGTQGVPPKSPEASLQCLQTHDDLRVELVVAEPLVVDPVAIDFGPDGRLWVAEMNDYGHDVYETFSPTGRVRWLRDTDGDGTFDQAETFVEGLRFPTDVKVQPDGVLICDAPDILFAVDMDGDGKADSVQKLYTGFEVRNAQARVNSLRLGLDNWLHGSGGLFGGNITNERTNEQIDLSSRDFRFQPTTGVIEPVTGRTQQGRCRNDWGDWFGCTNSTLLLHYAVDDAYHHRNPLSAPPSTTIAVATGPDASKLIPPGELVTFELSGAPGAPTSACGLDIYRDRLLGDEYYGNAFTCEPVHQLVHRLVLDPSGVTFNGRRADNELDREFLASTDRWFRPVQVRTGPDGAIWVVDMYRYVIEHPRWIPQAALAELDVYAGQGRGRIYRIVPREASRPIRPWPRLDQMSDEELVGQLDQPNGTVRDMAQQLIVSRQEATTPLLQQMVRTAKLPQGQLHALCTLDGLSVLTAEDVLYALKSDHPEVVRHAVRLAEQFLDNSDVLTAIQQLASNPNPRVSRQVAYSLGECKNADAAETLAALAVSAGNDKYLRAAVLSSLNKSNVAAVLDAYVAAAGGKRSNVVSELVSLAVRLGDAQGVEAAIRVVVANAISSRADQFIELASLLDAVDARSDLPFGQLETGLLRELQHRHEEAHRTLADDKQGEGVRLAALRLLGRRLGAVTQKLLTIDDDARERTLQQISELISAKQSIAIQHAAVAALARTTEAVAADLLLARWDGVGPSTREQILDVLLSRDDWTRQLVAQVQAEKLPTSTFNASRRQQLVTHRDATIRDSAAKLFDTATLSNRVAVIDSYRPALAGTADAERGRELFRKACSSCHRLEDHGHTVGPDLMALTNRDPEWLLTTILDPNREVDARYMAWTAIDNDGIVRTGLLTEETSAAIRLREANDKEHVILRSDLDELRNSNRSIMPEGLERDLSPRDVADVLAYVSRFDLPFKQFAGNQPRPIEANEAGELRLTAATAEIRGNEIVFESQFGNIGYWHGEDDRVTWRVDVGQGGSFDVYLEFACADGSAGNLYRIDGLIETLRGVVGTTGGWDKYQPIRIGTTAFKAGRHVISVRPDGPLSRGALFDLREVRLVPAGKTTPFDTTATPDAPLPRQPEEIAPFLLDDSQSMERRQAAIDRRPGMGPGIVALLVAEIDSNAEEEYRRIPWIWRVAIAVGKRNDGGELRDLLDVSLPQSGEPLRDWQAVVIGGGVINGISQLGVWPDERLADVIAGVPNGAARWQRVMELAATMADDESVRSGTRYDALRMIALAGWDQRGEHLRRYLANGVNDELQMGAVSGLVDIQADEVADVLIERLPQMSARNQKLAIEGLLRTEQRCLAMLEAMAANRLSKELVERKALREHASVRVRDVAKRVLE
jgi:putative membrane-bound dehydrogenase-like protein